MTRLPASKVRTELADTLNRVAYGGERIVLHRRGKDVAVLVPLADLELLRALEDRLDNAAAEESLREPGASVPWKKAKADLGLV
jgi:prevent-host-death family protein